GSAGAAHARRGGGAAAAVGGQATEAAAASTAATAEPTAATAEPEAAVLAAVLGAVRRDRRAVGRAGLAAELGQGAAEPGWGPAGGAPAGLGPGGALVDRKSTRLNSSHVKTSYAVFCL